MLADLGPRWFMLLPAGTQTQEEGKARDLTQGNVTQMQRLDRRAACVCALRCPDRTSLCG